MLGVSFWSASMAGKHKRFDRMANGSMPEPDTTDKPASHRQQEADTVVEGYKAPRLQIWPVNTDGLTEWSLAAYAK